VYYAMQAVLKKMHRSDPHSINSAIASESSSLYGFSLQKICGFGSSKASTLLLDADAPKRHAILKLTSWERVALQGREGEFARLYDT